MYITKISQWFSGRRFGLWGFVEVVRNWLSQSFIGDSASELNKPGPALSDTVIRVALSPSGQSSLWQTPSQIWRGPAVRGQLSKEAWVDETLSKARSVKLLLTCEWIWGEISGCGYEEWWDYKCGAKIRIFFNLLNLHYFVRRRRSVRKLCT